MPFIFPCVLRRFALLMLMLASLPSFASRPGAMPATDKDVLELEHYTLTMDKLNRMGEAMSDFSRYAQNHPEDKEVMTTDADKKDDLDGIAARISRAPEVVSILGKHGFSPREFVVLEMTYIQAALAFALKPADKSDTEYGASVHVNPANLVFLRTHQSELKEWQTKHGNDASS